MTVAIIGFAVVLTLIFLRLPIGIAMALVGGIGFALLTSTQASWSMIAQTTYSTGLDYTFSTLPLFILMGNFINRAGFSDELYAASHAFLGHRRGGLATATIVASGGLAAVSGSSLATAATMAKIAMPPMRRYGYADSLAAGAIAAGGTLGIIIPPSVIMVVYGVITETDIGSLFIAGIVPGVLGVIGYSIAIEAWTRINPAVGPRGERTGWPDRLRALTKVWGILVLFLLVIGGIYGGAFTATEAAGIGASGAFFLALARGSLTWRVLVSILAETVATTTVIFVIVIGALIFANFVNLAGLPVGLSAAVEAFNVTPIAVILAIVVVYLILGCVLDSLSMILLTVPTFYPLVVELGYSPIWFGILVTVATEISLITPPIGLNVFVLRAALPEVPTSTIFRGIFPFLYADVVRLLLIVFVPAIALFLPSLR
ncbi:MAG: TRAP transporter large permease [Alphaproteobacteria bacterium]|nr:TRAP transporter large permease [Alphaproteobacteria bacterium]